MGGMVLTKREGMLLAALLLARCGSRRGAPVALGVVRALVLVAVIVAVIAAPWRIWYIVRGVAGEAPAGGGIDPTENTERLWPSFRLAFDVLFSSTYWNVAVSVAIGALVLRRARAGVSPALFFGALLLLVTLGGGWITWAIPDLPITQELGGNPIVRYMGAAALLVLGGRSAPPGQRLVTSDVGGRVVVTARAWLVVGDRVRPAPRVPDRLGRWWHSAVPDPRRVRPAGSRGTAGGRRVRPAPPPDGGRGASRPRVVAVGFVGTDVAAGRLWSLEGRARESSPASRSRVRS